MSKYIIKHTTQFKKGYKLAMRRGLNIALLDEVIIKLANLFIDLKIGLSSEKLDERFRDHALSGKWSKYRECHIQPDWLLVYHINENILVLTLSRTGTHSDLFQK